MALGEREAIRILASVLGARAGTAGGVELGIGDDCAVLKPARGRLVVTNDACLEGVHYRRRWLSMKDVAHKSLGASVSDVAAMGAKVRGIVAHVTLPPYVTRDDFLAFARGQREFCRRYGCSIIGGNIASGAGFDVVTTVFGEVPSRREPLLRSGANVGEEVWLVGKPGLAHLGLRSFLAEESDDAAFRGPRRAFRRPVPRLVEGVELLGRASAALDVSDGLVPDAGHLAAASGVRLVLDAQRLRSLWSVAERRTAARLGEEPLTAILFGGEDYGLLATGRPSRRPSFAKPIGVVEDGSGVVLVDGGERTPLEGGFEHGGRLSRPAPTSFRAR